LIIQPGSEALGIRQGELKLAGQFVHSHDTFLKILIAEI
jgi:hypothetical protein